MSDLEQSIDRDVQDRELPNHPPTETPLNTTPPDVAVDEGVPRIAQLSAEAVMRDWEKAAKQIEAMGHDLTGLAARSEEMSRDVLDTVRLVDETAALYRQQARKVFRRIEERLTLAENVRKACVDLRTKLSSDIA